MRLTVAVITLEETYSVQVIRSLGWSGTGIDGTADGSGNYNRFYR